MPSILLRRDSTNVRTPEGGSCCYRLPSESPRRKRTLKPKGLMSPSAEAHCDARKDRARVASHDASLFRCSRSPLRTRFVRGYVLVSGKVILMIPSLVARRDTCMVVLARQEVQLDKHARLDSPESQKYAIHMHEYERWSVGARNTDFNVEEVTIFLWLVILFR